MEQERTEADRVAFYRSNADRILRVAAGMWQMAVTFEQPARALQIAYMVDVAAEIVAEVLARGADPDGR